MLDLKLLGVRIRQARERLNMSQEDLAAAVSKDQGAISDYETGKRKLAVVDLPLFATALDVSLMYFFEEIDSQDFDTEMLNYLHQIPTADAREAVVNIVRIYAAQIIQAFSS